MDELRVAIGVALSLARLAIGLQTELLLMQQFADQRAANPMAFGDQCPRQLRQALACPAQRRHRIAARVRLDQCQQIGRPAWYPAPLASCHRRRDDGSVQASSGSAAANSFKPRPIVLAADPRGAHHRRDTAIPGRLGFRRRKDTPGSLVQVLGQGGITLANRGDVDHPQAIHTSIIYGNPPRRDAQLPDSVICGRGLSAPQGNRVKADRFLSLRGAKRRGNLHRSAQRD